MYCKYCGKENKEEAKFCRHCGKKLKREDTTKENVVESKLSSQEPSQERIKEEFLKLSEFPREPSSKTEELFGYAGFWIRVGAFIIDYVVMLILAFIFVYFWDLTWGPEADMVVGLFILIVYHTLFLSIYSSTPGKLLYDLRVIDENSKEKITFRKALGRSLSYIISSFIFGLGFWVIGFDKEKQGWHDKIARTVVVKEKKKRLVIPIILTVIAFCLSLYVVYFLGEETGMYDFDYLGGEATMINLIQEKISEQSPGFCCSYASSLEFNEYLNDVPLELSFEEKEKNAQQIFEDFSRAIVVIGGDTESDEFGFASGFLISPSGLLVTNYHVIEDMSRLAVVLDKNKVFDVNTIVAEDSNKDIAVLKIKGTNLPYIVMGDSDLVKVGQKIFAIGNPEGYANTISEGIISQIREFEPGIDSLQITAPISLGSSGGALLNTMGEVIGVTNMIDWYGQNINFAVPINEVKDLLGIGISYSIENPTIDSDLCTSGCYYNGECYQNPPNSHCIVNDLYNAWLCDDGFTQVGNYCVNCSDSVCNRDYPGSKFSYYDTNSYECVCDCPIGYEWNMGKTACVIHQETPDERCKDYYGQNSYWDGTSCQCAYGYVWNASRSTCITKTASCQETWPNSYWNGEYSTEGKFICACITGYVWDYNDTACVTRASIDQICRAKYGASSYYLGYVEDGKYMCK